jgi:hypothetical protein
MRLTKITERLINGLIVLICTILEEIRKSTSAGTNAIWKFFVELLATVKDTGSWKLHNLQVTFI